MLYLLLLLASFSTLATSAPKCTATYDEIQITRQEVATVQDFYYCFGYHHGRDRAWMMDYFRRSAQGRNAEIYGYSWLKSDLMMRLLDLPTHAQRLYEGLPKENKDWLEAYAQGVNAGFIEGKMAQEFKDLNYTPEKWEPFHSIQVLILQSFDQTRKTFFRDYEEEKLKEHWKEKAIALFDDENMPWHNTILKSGEYETKKTQDKTSYSPAITAPNWWGNFPEVFGKESGSNNWVVSKEKSKSGYAMLANDPHLDLKTPLFWYWINLKSKNFDLIGASLPGVPVVVSGTNGKVAWGITNAYIKTGDVVFLKDYPKDYLTSFRPTVKIKFLFFKIPFFFKTFERTKNHEPVIPLELKNKDKMILRWAGFSMQPEDLVPMFNLVNIENTTQMDESLKKVGIPAWNFVFADTHGDIGFRVVGKAFRKTSKIPFGVSYETLDQFKKKEFLDAMERPNLLRPKRNYIYTANNRHWPSDSKFYGGRGYSYAFRGFRIDELLKEGKHDLESFKKIQCDRQVVDARFFVEKIINVTDIPEFKDWDYFAHEDSVATSVYRRLMDLLMEKWQVNEYGLFKLLDELSAEKKMELQSFYKLAKEQVRGRSWSDFHRLPFSHLSKNTDWKFSPELPGIGDNHSVDPGTSKWDSKLNIYEQLSGASMRMIVVMKKVPEVYLSLPGLNRNYTQASPNTPAWNEWRSCKYTKINL
jgi:penicillin G amidase